MTHLPTRSSVAVGDLLQTPELPEEPGGPRIAPWATLVRNRWIVIGCVIVATAAAIVFTLRTTPLYESSASLRIEQKQHNLPTVFLSPRGGNELITEMQVLRSRTLLEYVAAELGAQLVVTEPRGPSRFTLFSMVQVTPTARQGSFRLRQQPDSQLVLVDSAGARLAEGRDGRLEYDGLTVVLGPGAAAYPEIGFHIGSQAATAEALATSLKVTRPTSEAEIVRVAFQSPDSGLAWRVPNAVVARFVEQRQAILKTEARSTVEFLREQIGTIEKQLATSERELRSYRESQGVINPQSEATSQVGRLVQLQADRAMLESQRSALAMLLEEVDRNAEAQGSADLSPYRRLMAFPGLLGSQAAAGLLQALTQAEDQRKELLVRRTLEDSDVQALTSRIGEIEAQLRGIAATYLQSMTNQVASLDGTAGEFRSQLRNVPQRELQYARLEREPKVLEGIYTMLQTRLKEAEVAAAVRDPSVRVVDPALQPTRPILPRKGVNIAAGILAGALLGLAAAAAREYFDRAVRTRADVRTSTGLPVLGLIPRIGRRAKPVAVIAERSSRKKHSESNGAPLYRPPIAKHGYTFLGHAQEGGGDRHVPSSTTPAPDAPVFNPSELDRGVEEAYAILRTNIAFARLEGSTRTLVVTSPLSGDGKTTTAVNLALALAQQRHRVLLIDADLRRGSIHGVFGVPRKPGLVEVLRGTVRLESAIRAAAVGEHGVLYYLTSGQATREDLGLATGPAIPELLRPVQEAYDLVLLDTPPVNVITDAALMGTWADGVLLVARAGVTDAAALAYAVQQLRHVRAPLLGVVLNDIDLRRDAAYDRVYRSFGYQYTPTAG